MISLEYAPSLDHYGSVASNPTACYIHPYNTCTLHSIPGYRNLSMGTFTGLIGPCNTCCPYSLPRSLLSIVAPSPPLNFVNSEKLCLLIRACIAGVPQLWESSLSSSDGSDCTNGFKAHKHWVWRCGSLCTQLLKGNCNGFHELQPYVSCCMCIHHILVNTFDHTIAQDAFTLQHEDSPGVQNSVTSVPAVSLALHSRS